ncbi:hypothetical protein E2320_023025, partial [Naja naja]
ADLFLSAPLPSASAAALEGCEACMTFYPRACGSLRSWFGDGPLRMLLLPSIHLEALDLLAALILA